MTIGKNWLFLFFTAFATLNAEEVDISQLVINTVAGTGAREFNGDGPVEMKALNLPAGTACFLLVRRLNRADRNKSKKASVSQAVIGLFAERPRLIRAAS